ncbi:sigma 54-interacting transcriptional regulator [Marispirochaeta sp.]|uniref:sigma 54-interacting transcriptional regulator n=1 Tax=Marispirochaeta sp. TaxID=2038653 RepID=UPI0029C61F71|nr:sigma 54-interacting transcriptional regulator [Marispirochaeta sp.]
MKNLNNSLESPVNCVRCEVQFKEILELLDSLNRTIQDDEDISLILRDSLLVLSRRSEFLRGSVTILDRRSGRIFTKESFGFSSEEQNRGIYVLGEGITGEVVETGKPIMVERISADPRFLNRTGARRNVGEENTSFLCVPVKSNREVIGTLSIDRETGDLEETMRDLKVIEIVASMISQAVRLYRAHHEERQELISENLRLTEALEASLRPRHIIGETTNMRGLYAMVKRVARTNATVLILGESGVGKELVARAVHEESDRREKPFISLNCAALPENIIESELFGHERGAFTGAVAERKGRFELAEGGTIFLDEIGELSMNMQAKLLRVLQEREFERVGGMQTLRADVRVLAATNRDLEEEVRQTRFREDLYYRLNIIPLTVPPFTGTQG